MNAYIATKPDGEVVLCLHPENDHEAKQIDTCVQEAKERCGVEVANGASRSGSTSWADFPLAMLRKVTG